MWWRGELGGELQGSLCGCWCECITGSCQRRGGISWSDADRGCLQAAGAQPDWHPVYSRMTSGLGMGVTGILIHLAMWKPPWNAVWWSLCRLHTTRIIEELQHVWATSPLLPGCARSTELTHMHRSTFSHIDPPTRSVENLSQIRCHKKHKVKPQISSVKAVDIKNVRYFRNKILSCVPVILLPHYPVGQKSGQCRCRRGD